MVTTTGTTSLLRFDPNLLIPRFRLQRRHGLVVSRSWYNATVYSPGIRTTTLVDCEFYSWCREELAHGEAFTCCRFIRSGGLLITVRVQHQCENWFSVHLKEASSFIVIGCWIGHTILLHGPLATQRRKFAQFIRYFLRSLRCRGNPSPFGISRAKISGPPFPLLL